MSPRFVYADASRPEMVDGFTKKTFTAMVEGVREAAIAEGLATAEAFDQGRGRPLSHGGDDGTFCYTFFKATGRGDGHPQLIQGLDGGVGDRGRVVDEAG